MFRGIVIKFCDTVLLLFFVCFTGFSQEKSSSSVRIMFYNTENLFDTDDDPLTDDQEFLPSGPRRWNNTRYHEKLLALSKTLIAAGGWSTPSIVGFAEVENKRVLLDLISETPLEGSDYSIIHEDSYDSRGIDVAVIYKPSEVQLINFKYLYLYNADDKPVATRPILRTCFKICNDTLITYFNHWPSRRGGVMAGEELRFRLAEQLVSDIDSITSERRGSKIIITGDFNATPSDEVIKYLVSNISAGTELVNLSADRNFGSGTYRYQGMWETIDQVIVSESILPAPGTAGMLVSSAKAFQDDFLFTNDLLYPGKSPYSTWRGFEYTGGFSDHLPVVIDVRCFTSLPW